MVQRTCKWKGCNNKFNAKPADIKRGWGQFCSKSCKAKHQSCHNPNAYDRAVAARNEQDIHDAGMDAVEEGWDGHKAWTSGWR